MAKLEELIVGSSVSGLVNNESVQVVATKWYGSSVLGVTFKNNQGLLAEQLLYREDEARLTVEDANLPWSFDADGDIVRLASEAYRINLAHIFDPYAVAISITDLIRRPMHDSIMKHFVTLDKLSGANIETGITIVHFEGVKELLKVLCEENGIDYDLDSFSMECIESIRALINEKWSGTEAYMMNESTAVIHC